MAWWILYGLLILCAVILTQRYIQSSLEIARAAWGDDAEFRQAAKALGWVASAVFTAWLLYVMYLHKY